MHVIAPMHCVEAEHESPCAAKDVVGAEQTPRTQASGASTRLGISGRQSAPETHDLPVTDAHVPALQYSPAGHAAQTKGSPAFLGHDAYVIGVSAVPVAPTVQLPPDAAHESTYGEHGCAAAVAISTMSITHIFAVTLRRTCVHTLLIGQPCSVLGCCCMWVSHLGFDGGVCVKNKLHAMISTNQTTFAMEIRCIDGKTGECYMRLDGTEVEFFFKNIKPQNTGVNNGTSYHSSDDDDDHDIRWARSEEMTSESYDESDMESDEMGDMESDEVSDMEEPRTPQGQKCTGRMPKMPRQKAVPEPEQEESSAKRYSKEEMSSLDDLYPPRIASRIKDEAYYHGLCGGSPLCKRKLNMSLYHDSDEPGMGFREKDTKRMKYAESDFFQEDLSMSSVRKLVESGNVLAVCDKHGNNVLMLAIYHGKTHIANYLLNNCSDDNTIMLLKAKNNHCLNAYTMAKEMENSDVIEEIDAITNRLFK